MDLAVPPRASSRGRGASQPLAWTCAGASTDHEVRESPRTLGQRVPAVKAGLAARRLRRRRDSRAASARRARPGPSRDADGCGGLSRGCDSRSPVAFSAAGYLSPRKLCACRRRRRRGLLAGFGAAQLDGAYTVVIIHDSNGLLVRDCLRGCAVLLAAVPRQRGAGAHGAGGGNGWFSVVSAVSAVHDARTHTPRARCLTWKCPSLPPSPSPSTCPCGWAR